MLPCPMIRILKSNVCDNYEHHFKSLWNFHKGGNTSVCQFSNIPYFVSKIYHHAGDQLDKAFNKRIISHNITQHFYQNWVDKTKYVWSGVFQTLFKNNSKEVEQCFFFIISLLMRLVKKAKSRFNESFMKLSKSLLSIFKLHQSL